MSRFSERIGVRAIRSIQVAAMDSDLRASLWNAIYERFGGYPSSWLAAAEWTAKYVLKVPIDSFHRSDTGSEQFLRHYFFEVEWHMAYEIVELLGKNVDSILNAYGQKQFVTARPQFIALINAVLERELSAYRFVDGILVPISSEAEVASIEAAANATGGAAQHIRAALALLGQKPSPDYRNSIKESISAVESIISSIAGVEPNGVARALEIIGKSGRIHPSLKGALKQLFGYASDEDGIRHAILEERDIGFTEAAFMLVTCSAFVNYFRAKSGQGSVP